MRKFGRASIRISVLSGLVLLLGACGAHATPGAQRTPATAAPLASTATPEHLNQALTSITWTGLPDIIASAKGFFAAQNLTVDDYVAGGSPAVCQQLLAKAADVGSCNLNDMAQVVVKSGAPLVQFFGVDGEPINQWIVAKPSIKSWSDLKGKTIIVGAPQDNTVFFFRTMARANALKDSDYNFTYAGSTPARYAALKSGAVDAAILVDPFNARAVGEGFTKIDALVPRYANSSNYGYYTAAVNEDWAKEHPEVLARYIRAEINAVNWIYAPANKQELFSIVGPKLNMDQATFDQLYQRDIVDDKFWLTNGEITDAGVQGVLNSLVELGELQQPLPPPSKFYDLSYVKLALAGLRP